MLLYEFSEIHVNTVCFLLVNYYTHFLKSLTSAITSQLQSCLLVKIYLKIYFQMNAFEEMYH